MTDWKIGTLWIEVTTRCNLECVWCYNKIRLNNKDMEHSDFENIILQAESQGIKNIVIVGGEPFMWPHIEKAIESINRSSLNATIITNGLFIKDTLLNKLKNKIKIVVSIKSTDNDFITKYVGNSYEIQETIKLLNDSEVLYTANILISKLNQHSVLNDIRNLKKVNVNNYYITFCRPTNCENGISDYSLTSENVNTFLINNYKEINYLTHTNVCFFMNYPLCEINMSILDTLVQNSQIMTLCSVLTHSGLFIDLDCKVKVCNNMPLITLAKYDGDLKDAIQHSYSKDSMIIRNELSLVYDKCLNCRFYSFCGGGCPLLRKNKGSILINKKLFGLGQLKSNQIIKDSDAYCCNK